MIVRDPLEPYLDLVRQYGSLYDELKFNSRAQSINTQWSKMMTADLSIQERKQRYIELIKQLEAIKSNGINAKPARQASHA